MVSGQLWKVHRTQKLESANTRFFFCSFEVNPNDGICNDHLPVAAIPIMATSSPNYQSNVSQVREGLIVSGQKNFCFIVFFARWFKPLIKFTKSFSSQKKGLDFPDRFVRLFSFLVFGWRKILAKSHKPSSHYFFFKECILILL